MIFEFNDAQILFGMFQGFKKATPYGGARKLRLTLPPVRRVEWIQMCHTNFDTLKSVEYFFSDLDNKQHRISYISDLIACC